MCFNTVQLEKLPFLVPSFSGWFSDFRTERGDFLGGLKVIYADDDVGIMEAEDRGVIIFWQAEYGWEGDCPECCLFSVVRKIPG